MWRTKNKFEIYESIFSAINVDERHSTLLANIGTFPEEREGFARIMFLSWILPSIVLATTLIDLILVFLYMRFLHPWRCILDDEVGGAQTIIRLLNSQVLPQVASQDTATKVEPGSEETCN